MGGKGRSHNAEVLTIPKIFPILFFLVRVYAFSQGKYLIKMIRKLLSVVFVLALGIVLISPCVDGDEAVHGHPHHHHSGLLVLSARSAFVQQTVVDPSPNHRVASADATSSISTMRC